jgi:hypothetical protein
MTAWPTPERLAWAYARNVWKDARRFPRQAATDVVLLVFVGLMLLGLLSRVVRETVTTLDVFAQIFVNFLPVIAGMTALAVRAANPVNQRRAVVGNWLSTLPVDANTHAKWSIRRAGYFALLISALGTIVLVDIALMNNSPAHVTAMSFALMVYLPVGLVVGRSLFQRKELLAPREVKERELSRARATAERQAAMATFEAPLMRGLVGFVSAQTSPAMLLLKLFATLAISVVLIVLAISKAQPQLLLLGAVLAPLMFGSSLELPIADVFVLSRSLPLGFRRLTWANVKLTLVPPLVFGVPFLVCAPFVPESWHWALLLLLTLPAVAVLLFLRIAIEQAYPQSKIARMLFSFAAAVGIGAFSMQAPLVAPFVGVVLGVAWLLERGWGVWEFGYGERAR